MLAKNAIIESLSYLASDKAQQRYIVNDTKDEYILPEQLLEDVLSFKHLGPSWNEYSKSEQNTILELLSFVDKNYAQLNFERAEYSNKELIENNETWKLIRQKAKESLNVFKVDLIEWEKREGL